MQICRKIGAVTRGASNKIIGALTLATILTITGAAAAQTVGGIKQESPALSPQAPVASITVTTTADTIDSAANCAGVTIGSLPGPDGQTSLREAICAANTNVGADTISFSLNGTFVLTGAANEDNGGSGDYDIKQSLTISGNGQTNTIIDGGGIERIFDVFPSAASTFAISNMTLRNGDTRTASFKEGGAMYLHNNVTTTIQNVSVTNNFSGSNGAIENRGTLTINNSTISGNQTLPVSGSVVGGGIHNVGTMSINATTISSNTVRGEGGGIATTTGAAVTVTITNSLISNNRASITGGGLGNGGGISTTGNQGTINITNSTISGNTSENNGGGIHDASINVSSQVNLLSVTVTNNTADFDNNGTGTGGGAFQQTAGLNLRNTIVAGNFNSTPATRDDISGAVNGTNSFNLVGDGTGLSGMTNGVNSNQVGSGASPINPLLSPLANNGGPTATHATISGSPAIDQGNAFGLTTDQRAIVRPSDLPGVPPAPGGDNSDIGAFERSVSTAAGVRITGRALSGDRPVYGATVTLTAEDGTVRVARTSNFGFYLFDDVESGRTYVLNIAAKQVTFAQPSRILSVAESVTDIDFIGEPSN